MGAWGYRVFEDDCTLDALAELTESDSPVKVMHGFFKTVLKSEYVEYDDACNALAAAAVIDSVLNGISHNEDDEEYGEFVGSLKPGQAQDLKKDAARAVERILAEESELKELWEENEQDYENWRKELTGIRKRLM